MSDADRSAELQAAVAAAVQARTPLAIVGGGSKRFYGRSCSAVPLQVAGHRGIVHYEPSELVLTARAGTPLAEVEALLAANGQMLGFEPPHFGAAATLGGAIACGLSGPRRPFSGAARDFVLGCRMLNGHGEVLQFGGEAMKNVAGFDVSRLLAGSLGTLGVILEVSLKVLPKPACERTLCLELPVQPALRAMLAWQRRCLPLSGLCWLEGRLYARLSGGEQALSDAARHLGGEVAADGDGFWCELREQRLVFFHAPGALWRIAVPPATGPLDLDGAWLYEWGGALRWLKSAVSAEQIFAAAQRCGGHAQLFRGRDHGGEVFQPLPENLRRLNARVKQAFDPHGIFNPGRCYAEL